MRLSTTTMKCLHGIADTKSEPIVHLCEYEVVTMGCDASCSGCCSGGCADGCDGCCSGDCHRGGTCDPDGDMERWIEERKAWKQVQGS